jgi:hypothetical protein
LERLYTSLQSLNRLNLNGCAQLSGDLSPLANLALLQKLDLAREFDLPVIRVYLRSSMFIRVLIRYAFPQPSS